MDSGDVPTEVMLAGERTSTRWVWAGVGLSSVRVMSLPVGLEIECSSESYKKTDEHRLHNEQKGDATNIEGNSGTGTSFSDRRIPT